MDIVLEFADRYAFDHLYAWLLPARPPPYDYPNINANSSSQAVQTWHFKPASAFLSVYPTQAAYMSAWPRDNIIRQYISLALITWYVNRYVLTVGREDPAC
jgi:Delta7-sterol 5-desaturase